MAVYAPANAAEIIDDTNNNATSVGDIVNLPSGAHDCSATTLAPSAGVTINGNADGTTDITGLFVVDLNDTTNLLTLSNFKVSSAAAAAGNVFEDGNFAFTDMEFDGTGMGANKLINVKSTTNASQCTMTGVNAHDSGADCISFEDPGSVGTSWGKLYNCEASTPGGGANDNCLTTHTGFIIDDYNGYYHTQNGGKAVVAANATTMRLHGTVVEGRVDCSHAQNMSCAADLAADAFIVSKYAFRCEGIAAGTGGLAQGFRTDTASGVFQSIVITGDAYSSYLVFFNATTGTVKASRISTASKSGRAGVYRNAGAGSDTVTIVNCYLDSNYYGMDLRCSQASPGFTLKLYNCVFTDSGLLDIRFVDSGTGTLVQQSGYNCIPGNVSAAYTKSGDGPDINGEGEIHADLWPIEGGNCDIGEGHPSIRTLGEPDLYGRPKLRAYEDVIGPVYPQRPNVRNNLVPLVQQGRDLVAANWS